MDYTQYNYKILCEDRHQFHFISGYLKHKNVTSRKIDCYPLVEGTDNASNHVKNNIEKACRELAARTTRCVLIVACDVDPLKDDRNQQSADTRKSNALVACNNLIRDFEEKIQKQCADSKNFIFLVLPCRNIETWFYFLDNQNSVCSADEIIDRKQCYKQAKPGAFGKQMAQLAPSHFPAPDCVPASLARTCESFALQKSKLS